jgi:hypothetical protein
MCVRGEYVLLCVLVLARQGRKVHQCCAQARCAVCLYVCVCVCVCACVRARVCLCLPSATNRCVSRFVPVCEADTGQKEKACLWI